MSGRPDWSREGCDWPNRGASRFVPASGITWHVQVMGEGPDLLLLHGSGAATHSWSAMLPALAQAFRVIAPDLPGHGFSETPPMRGLTLPAVARGIGELCTVLNVSPALIAGHSAGAAIACEMALKHQADPAALVSFAGALAPFPGLTAPIFSGLAQALFVNPLAVRFFAWRAAQPGAVARLIASTGSQIPTDQLEFYARLLRCHGHVEGTLGMMAAWKLDPLTRALSGLNAKLTLIAPGNDRAVPPSVAHRTAAIVPGAQAIDWPGLGHLAHEEDPARAVAAIIGAARDAGVLPRAS